MKSTKTIHMTTAVLALFVISFSRVSEAYVPYRCEDDTVCPPERMCYENMCTNSCDVRNSNLVISPCGPNTVCMSPYPHTAVCECLPLYRGNPDLGCYKISEDESQDVIDHNEIENADFRGEDNHI